MGAAQTRGLKEVRAVGSSYPLRCRWPEAGGAAPPGGERGRRGSVSSPPQGAGPEGPRVGACSEGICLLRAKLPPTPPPSRPSPTLWRDPLFHLARRPCTSGTGTVLFPVGAPHAPQDV